VQAEAEKLGSAFDSEARGLHLRADGIATMPMLRAAIGTDANTMKDMASNELLFTPARGESLELFQLGNDRKVVSLMRIPSRAQPLEPLSGRDTRLAMRDGKVTITASAPVAPLYHARAMAGSVAIAAEIDLLATQRRLAPRVQRAWLRGPTGTVPLVEATGGAPAGGAPVVTPLPSSSELSASELTLEVIPRPSGSGWKTEVRKGCWALAAGLAALFVQLQRQRRRR
jgi:hypothetical protein